MSFFLFLPVQLTQQRQQQQQHRTGMDRELAELRRAEEIESARRRKEIEQLELEMRADIERRRYEDTLARARFEAADEQRRKATEISLAKLGRDKSMAVLDAQRRELEQARAIWQLEREAEDESARLDAEAERLVLQRLDDEERAAREEEVERLRQVRTSVLLVQIVCLLVFD
jgi:hypothetical protein